MQPPKFTPDQLISLRDEGLTQPQIARLEAILPTLRFIRTPSPPMSDVRKELTDLQADVAAMQSRLRRFVHPPAGDRALLEASFRVQSPSQMGEELPTALAATENLATMVDAALASLPSEQRRDRRASPELIRLINRALWEGWGDDNMRTHDTSDVGRWEGLEKQAPLPPLPSRERSFLIIAATCFEALGDGRDNDPTRAIRNFHEEEETRRHGKPS